MTWLTGIEISQLKVNNFFTPLKRYNNDNSRSLTGFSLFELLVIVVIIGSLLAFSIPRFRSTFNNLEFDNFCQNLTNRMKYLQERASIEQIIYRLNLDLNNKLIRIESKKMDSDDFISVSGLLGKKIKVPDGLEIETSGQYVLFYPDGTLDGKDIEIFAFQNKATVYIKQTIGRIILLKNEQK